MGGAALMHTYIHTHTHIYTQAANTRRRIHFLFSASALVFSLPFPLSRPGLTISRVYRERERAAVRCMRAMRFHRWYARVQFCGPFLWMRTVFTAALRGSLGWERESSCTLRENERAVNAVVVFFHFAELYQLWGRWKADERLLSGDFCVAAVIVLIPVHAGLHVLFDCAWFRKWLYSMNNFVWNMITIQAIC